MCTVMYKYFVIVTCFVISSLEAQYILTGTPPNLIMGEDVTITLECITGESIVKWSRDTRQIAIIRNAIGGNFCLFSGTPNSNYIYTCDSVNGIYLISINVTVTAEFQSEQWDCGHIVGSASETFYFNVSVPVTRVTILPTGDNNVVDVEEGETQSFICTTDSSRPAAWIQWYVAGDNVTNQAQPQTQQIDGDKFISYSKLMYTGKVSDHNKVIYCEAINIEGRDTVISQTNSIYIQIPITSLTITPAGDNNVINCVEGEMETFICTTDSSRPAAWIQWYIGIQNVTNQAQPQPSQADGDKFISSSKLIYTGKTADHNQMIYCEAVNIEGRFQVTSQKKSIFLQIPVTTVTIMPVGDNNNINVLEGRGRTFLCTTDYSRPAALIQWYIGGQNVTNQAQPQTPQSDENKYISSSKLIYTGKDADHNKAIYCEGGNLEIRDKVISLKKYIYIQIGPKGISLSPVNSVYIVTETKGINLIICAAICRPNCNYTWTGPNGFMERHSHLQLHSVYRNQTGLYICHAENDLGIQTSNTVNIIVTYSPTVLQLETVNGNTIDEHQLVTFQCHVDSYPAPDITWIFSKTSILLNKEEDVFTSNYTIHKADCLQTGPYKCQASNVIDSTLVSSSKETDLFVLCSVRKDQRYPETPELIAIMENNELNITVCLLAYPKPWISWTMINSETGTISTVINANSFNVFEHISTVYIKQISKTDYGVYTVNAFNNIGLQFIQSFSVIPQGRPNQPTDVMVTCEITSMIVSWQPGFNGGIEQKFRVASLNIKTQHTEYSSWIMDSSRGQNKHYIVKSLDEDTVYIIYVEAINKHGIVRSPKNATCTTRSSLCNSQPNSYIAMSVGAGIGSSVLILLLAGVVVFVLKRRTYNKEENNKLYQSTHSVSCGQKTNNDQHNYNELQTIRMDSNPVNMKTSSSPIYEEIGKMNDGRNNQDVEKVKEVSDLQEQHKMSTLYSNMKI